MTATSFPRKTHSQNGRLGRSSGSRIKRAPAPSRVSTACNRSWSHSGKRDTVVFAGSSPVTAAGPQRNCTVFPILLPRRQAERDTQVFARRQHAVADERPHRTKRPRDCNRRATRFAASQFDGACCVSDDNSAPRGSFVQFAWICRKSFVFPILRSVSAVACGCWHRNPSIRSQGRRRGLRNSSGKQFSRNFTHDGGNDL